MLHKLSEARTKLGRFVESGVCDNDLIDERINEALERLIDDQDWECMRKFVRISVCNRAFPLPYNVEKVLWCDIDGTPGRVFGLPYQFLSSGPGDLDYRCKTSLYQDLADKGDDWPVMFDIPHQYEYPEGTDVTPEGMRIVAFSTSAADTSLTLTVRGFKDNGEEVAPGVSPGEEIAIHQWQGGVEGTMFGHWDHEVVPSTNYFKDIDRVLKPVTTGYVTLYAVDTTNNLFFFLAKYHPLQTIPQFRRYNITNHNVSVPTSVLALVKLRHVPLSDADDILPLDSLEALKLMLMSLREENNGNLQGALNFEERAKQVMNNRERSRINTGGMPVILDHGHRTSLGRHMNHGLNI